MAIEANRRILYDYTVRQTVQPCNIRTCAVLSPFRFESIPIICCSTYTDTADENSDRVNKSDRDWTRERDMERNGVKKKIQRIFIKLSD